MQVTSTDILSRTAAVPLYVKTGESVEFWQATNLDAGLGLARKLPCRDNLKWLSRARLPHD